MQYALAFALTNSAWRAKWTSSVLTVSGTGAGVGIATAGGVCTLAPQRDHGRDDDAAAQRLEKARTSTGPECYCRRPCFREQPCRA